MDGELTIFMCGGKNIETCPNDGKEHDWSGQRGVDTHGSGKMTGGEAYCIKCGLGAMNYSLLRKEL